MILISPTCPLALYEQVNLHFVAVPSANVILSSGEIEDIRQFIKGWRDGTQTALNNAADVPAKLAKATAKKIKLQMKRPGKFAVAQSGGGWFNK